MELILSQIENALEKKLHYLAVTSVLTLPDLCSALETSDGKTDSSLYKLWFDTWKHGAYSMITGRDLYLLRCGVVHQGRLGHEKSEYTRGVFTVKPGYHCCINISDTDAGVQEKVLQLDASQFCRDMIASVQSWYRARRDDPNVQRHMPFLLRFRPNGLPPHFVNIPVIA